MESPESTLCNPRISALRLALKKYDAGDRKLVSFTELEDTMQSCGIDTTDAQICDLVGKLDPNKTGFFDSTKLTNILEGIEFTTSEIISEEERETIESIWLQIRNQLSL